MGSQGVGEEVSGGEVAPLLRQRKQKETNGTSFNGTSFEFVKILHSKGNRGQNEKTTCCMADPICT